MQIKVAKTAGFCFGVRNALSVTEAEIAKRQNAAAAAGAISGQTDGSVEISASGTGRLCTLGPLIHNEDVIHKLEEQGVTVLQEPEKVRQGDRVIIRAHGVGKDVYRKLAERGAEIIDATCPFVSKIQKIAEKESALGNTLLILGNPAHPEVIGIQGWASRPCLFMQSPEDEIPEEIRQNPEREFVIAEQTTFKTENFKKIVDDFKKLRYNYRVYPTICSATASHQREARELSAESDMMIVVGGVHSSNTKKLVEICEEHCPVVCFAENAEGVLNYLRTHPDIREKIHTGLIQQIGVTAGASTPNYILQEVVNVMSENFGEMLQEDLKDMHPEVHPGDVVKGIAVQVTDNEITLDIGYKADATMYKDEYTTDNSVNLREAVKVGDEIPVIVAKIGDPDVLVSHKRYLQNQAYFELEEAYKNHQVLTGTVTETMDNGVVAAYKNYRVFIPASLLDIHKIDPKTLEGQEISFRIIRLQRRRNRIMGDRRSVRFDERNAKREETLAKIEVGARMEGTIKTLMSYCAFVDLGGIDGMLHISEMSWGPIRNPNQLFTVGQKVMVMIKSFDPETRKISLTAKLPETNPWNNAEEKYAVGSLVEGKVVRFTDFGAFVELEQGLDGLIHISRLSDHFVKHPSEVLEINQPVVVKVIDLNPEQKRVSLSLRDAVAEEEIPEEGYEEAPEGEYVEEYQEEEIPADEAVEEAPEETSEQ